MCHFNGFPPLYAAPIKVGATFFLQGGRGIIKLLHGRKCIVGTGYFSKAFKKASLWRWDCWEAAKTWHVLFYVAESEFDANDFEK